MLMAISSFIKFAQSSRNSINIARLALNTTHISHLVILSHAKRLLVAADQSQTKKRKSENFAISSSSSSPSPPPKMQAILLSVVGVILLAMLHSLFLIQT
jgi:hypothetical protein